MAVAMFPQRCVGTAHGYRWPDILVVAARGGRRVTAVVELDGAPITGTGTQRSGAIGNLGERFACGRLRGGQAGIADQDL